MSGDSSDSDMDHVVNFHLSNGETEHSIVYSRHLSPTLRPRSESNAPDAIALDDAGRRNSFVSPSIVMVTPGADPTVDRTDSHGRTPLMHAAIIGDEPQALSCMDRGADVNARDNTGITALMLAAQHGHSAVVHDLLVCGAEINLSDDSGCTAVSLAQAAGHQHIVRMLLDRGGGAVTGTSSTSSHRRQHSSSGAVVTAAASASIADSEQTPLSPATQSSSSSDTDTSAASVTRTLQYNDPVANSKLGFPSNRIKTSKYTILTFLPLNLLEQFRRLANSS